MEELVAGVATRGPVAVREYAQARAWAEGPLWDWLNVDEKRLERYRAAKRYKAEMRVGEALEVADVSGDAKLVVDTSFRVAKSWFRSEYGEQVKVAHSGMLPVLNITIAGEGGGRVVGEVPVALPAVVVETEEI